MNIAVIDLDPTGISNNEAQFLSDRLRTELFETGTFQVVEREKMNTILKEQGFQQSGCTSVECAIEIGQLLNVTVMVAGSIGKIEEIYSISIRMIDVETGAIIRTATRDYEGKLSEVLTDVIPEISVDLAESEPIESGNADEEERLSKTVDDEQDFNRWAILLKAGFSFLNYTNDINQAINDLDPAFSESIDELSNHSNIGFEIRYALSEVWILKIGLGVESLISQWSVTFNNSVLFQKLSFERDYQFVNTYIGINYSLWQKPNIYDIYLGTDIGSTLFTSKLSQYLLPNDGFGTQLENTYEYNAFTWKLSLGGLYFLSSRFSLGLELALKGGGKFDTSDQLPVDNPDGDSGGIIYPREVNSAGLQIVLYFGYHF
jgi:TolB-like protein